MWKFVQVSVVFIILCNCEGVKIIPTESEITVAAGSDLSLECFGSDPLIWKYPSNDDEAQAERKITNDKVSGGHYKSTLRMFKLTYLDVGYYTCLSDKDETERTEIYVYVSDVNNLLVYNQAHLYLMKLQGEAFYIPCRISFSNVKVTLWNESEDQLEDFPFDPHYGFLVNNPKLTHSGIYSCRALYPGYPNASQELPVTIHMSPKTDDIKKPKIILRGEKPGAHVMVGQNIVLECSVTVSDGVHIHFAWRTPVDNIENLDGVKMDHIGYPIKLNGVTGQLKKSTLALKHVTKEFEGPYECTVIDHSNNTNQDEYNLKVHSEDTAYLNLTVDGKDLVIVRGEGSKAEWTVNIIAHPTPKITWFDPHCKKLLSDSKKYNVIHDYNISRVVIHDSRIRDSGYYEIHAENTVGMKKLRVYLAVEDIPQVTVNVDAFYLRNEEHTIKCTVLAEPQASVILTFTPCVQKICNENNRTYISVYHRNSSTVAKEYFGKIKAVHNGHITCSASNRYGGASNYSDFNVIDPQPPVFNEVVMGENENYVSVPVGELVKWTCRAVGLPTPTIRWFKGEYELELNGSRIHISDNNETLTIPMRSKQDDGVYKCIVSNIAGTVVEKFTLKMSTEFVLWHWTLLASATLVILVCVGVFINLSRRIRQEKKSRRAAETGLNYFQEGQIGSLNPDLSIGEQADLLPYHKKWEVPREKIKLGIQLGSGAFGVVMKAEVQGLRPCESSTTVAVKMAKKNSDCSLVKSLVSELKIMSHLGQHLNVVNLLGACTSGIYSGELLVLVEYCRYGNLHNYLLKHRDSFINQVNPNSGNLDLTERYNDSSNSNMYLVSNSEIYQAGSDYGGLKSVDTEMTTCYGPPSIAESDNNTRPPQSPVGEDGYLISQPFNKENCNKRMTTKDLICWCYQVARGMEYLASRKVLHGDLATRNILLADENVVKICDFGFAKSMYHDDNYTKKGNDPLPLKWLSIEALRDRVFSTQSDIWAYGIVLWEIFSLAKTPYPGKQFDQQLFDSLLEGYRLEKPDYATEDIYNLMLECWKEQPMLRPSFTECADRLGNMLEESVVQHYMELNDPYMKFNAMIPETEDYLNKINSPIYTNFCANTSTNDSDGPGTYLNMSKRQEQEMEMKPMIEHGVKSFLNPGYEGLNEVVMVGGRVNNLSCKRS